MRGLIIELLPEGGYNVQYWYEDPNNVYPIEVVVDGISVADAGENITLKFHPELAKDDPQMAESYNDYPQAARNNAKRAIEYKEENGSSCGTSVGWTRARQLVNGDKISLDTIKRMAASTTQKCTLFRRMWWNYVGLLGWFFRYKLGNC